MSEGKAQRFLLLSEMLKQTRFDSRTWKVVEVLGSKNWNIFFLYYPVLSCFWVGWRLGWRSPKLVDPLKLLAENHDLGLSSQPPDEFLCDIQLQCSSNSTPVSHDSDDRAWSSYFHELYESELAWERNPCYGKTY